jgi:hypothetical protein
MQNSFILAPFESAQNLFFLLSRASSSLEHLQSGIRMGTAESSRKISVRTVTMYEA